LAIVAAPRHCHPATGARSHRGVAAAHRRRRRAHLAAAAPSPFAIRGGPPSPHRAPRRCQVEASSSRGKPLTTLSARRLANSGAGRRSHGSNWAAPAAAHAPRAAQKCMLELRGQGTSLETKVRGPSAPTHDLNRTQRILVEHPSWVAPSMSVCYRRASAEALSPSRGVLIATLRMRRARHAPLARRCTKDGRSGRADTEVFNSREASSPRRSPATLLANFRHRPPPHGSISQPRRRTRPSSSKSAC
jgi:hypothetical protein